MGSGSRLSKPHESSSDPVPDNNVNLMISRSDTDRKKERRGEKKGIKERQEYGGGKRRRKGLNEGRGKRRFGEREGVKEEKNLFRKMKRKKNSKGRKEVQGHKMI